MAKETKNSGDPPACSPGDLSKAIKTTTFENTKMNLVPLDQAGELAMPEENPEPEIEEEKQNIFRAFP